MRPELVIADDALGVAMHGLRWLLTWIWEPPSEPAPRSVALAGGSTPRPLYEAIARRVDPTSMEHVTLWFGDERCVPPDDPESNYRMVKEALLDPVGEEHFAGVERVRGEEDPEAEAARYAQLLPDALDVVILGMGEDGHTASLFPGSWALEEAERRAVAVVGPKPPPDRITITPRVIRAAKRVLVVAAGHGKARALHRALEGPADVDATPIQLALPDAPGQERVWIVDRAAAADLHAGWWS